jgi:hypothetical protein
MKAIMKAIMIAIMKAMMKAIMTMNLKPTVIKLKPIKQI